MDTSLSQSCAGIGVTAVQKVGGRSEGRSSKPEGLRAGGGVLGEGAASPSPPARESGGAL